jgi:ribosomal protein L21E
MAGNTGIVMKVSKHAVTIRIDSIQVDFVVNVPIQHIAAETK